jgi:flagellar biosynthesis protein FlhF
MASQTFRAQNVNEALQQVQESLGSDAIVVSVRQVTGPAWQVWRAPEVEVVAIPGARKPAAAPAKAQASPLGEYRRQAELRREQPANPDAERAAAIAATLLAAVREKKAVAANSPTTQPGPQKPIARPGYLPTTKTPPARRPSAARPRPAAAQGRGAPTADPAEDLLDGPVATQPETAASGAALEALRRQLSAQGVDASVVKRVIDTCLETLHPRSVGDAERVREFAGLQLQAELRDRSKRSERDPRPITDRVVCLVGTASAGKTSLTAKLAAHYSQELGRRVAWICADTVSAGAIASARMYTEMLGLPLHVAYTPGDLAEAVAAEADCDLVLVDTAGCNPYIESSLMELGDLLTCIPHRGVYLTASATAKEGDLIRILTAFKPFNLTGLIFTRLDETGTYGSLYNLAWRSRLPITYFSSGPRVPDDLHPARAARLMAALLGQPFRA